MKLYETIMGGAVKLRRQVYGNGEQTKFTNHLKSIEYKSRDELHTLQAEKMSVFLKHAVENVPYYSQFKGELKLSPNTVHVDIKEFPILTKKIINEKGSELLSKIDNSGKRYKTGGTSGQSATILRDKSEYVHSANEYFNSMIGIVPGKSRLLIRRAESVYFAKNAHDVKYSANPISKTYIVSPAYMDNEQLELLFSVYSSRKPKLIMGITDPIYRFANYIIESNLKTYPVESIQLGGQTLMPQHRKTIEKAFKTDKIFDGYGATEFGIVAHQCEQIDKWHYIPEIHYLEVLDDNFKEVAAGKSGQFIVTNLWKRNMPLIRYQIDDIAVMSDEKCACGRGLPLVAKFEGRRIESVVSPKHTYMTPLPFFEIMAEFNNVDDFLVEQNSESTVTIKLIMKSGEFSLVQQLSLRKDINRYLDYPMKLEIEYINEIIPLPNGKVMRVKGYNKQ
ncbi:MAG: phenylacetate--CoA ligase family protein [Clostridiales bacterium]|nr:phenylacetate--CoA ligase family protein [Clostridiales bacterium]